MTAGTEDILTFDIGGTSMRGALYRPRTDRLQASVRRPTPNFHEFPGVAPREILQTLIERLELLSEELLQGRTARRICVGFPGPIDAAGNALAAPTVWGETDSPLPVQQMLIERWPDSRVLLLNDIAAAGYRYLKREDESLCVVTVSSGIGHKVFAHGHPLTGPGGRGGEIGHLRVDHSDDAPRCECGYSGHLGALASGRASAWQARRLAAENPSAFETSWLAKLYGARPGELDNAWIVEAFHREDPWCVELVTRMAQPLGHALAGIHLAVGVERFVIIGGFALNLGPRYVESVASAAGRCAWSLGGNWSDWIELGAADDEAGLIGAGRYAERVTGGAP